MLEKVNCNLCGSDNSSILCKVMISPLEEMSSLVKCKRCGLAYVNPRHPVDEEREFYKSEHYERYNKTLWQEGRVNIFRDFLKKIESLHSKGRLLDVGCGMGFFLKMASDNGWETRGVEISSSAVRYGRETLGLLIEEGELKDANLPDGSFDVITAWNVIDQAYDPLEELRQMCRLLRGDGLACLRVSNATFHLSLQHPFKILRRIWPGGEMPVVFHIYMFSPQTIRTILRKAGFGSIRVVNSRLGEEVPALVDSLGHWGERLVRTFTFGFAELLSFISLGRWVVGPSLLVFARKCQ